MKVIALFDVNEETLKEYGTFEGECGWLEQSGISVISSEPVAEGDRVLVIRKG